MRDVYEFIKDILKEWNLTVSGWGLTTLIYGGGLLIWDKLPKIGFFVLLLLTLFVAVFRVWRRDREKIKMLNEKIETLSKTEVDYIIDYLIEPFESEDISHIKKNLQIEKKELLNEIESLKKKEREQKLREAINPMEIRLLSVDDPTSATLTDFLNKLIDYERNIDKLIDKFNKIKKVILGLKNISNTYDQDINVQIIGKGNYKFYEYKTLKNLIPQKPERPKSFFERNFLFNPPFNNIFPPENGASKLKVINFETYFIEVEIDTLRVEEVAYLTGEPIFIETDLKEIEIEYEIKSKNTKKPIKKKIKIDMTITKEKNAKGNNDYSIQSYQ